MIQWDKENIIKFIEENGYKFIEIVEYKYIRSKVKIWCGIENHEPYIVDFYSFKSGSRCKHCYDLKRGCNQKFTFDFVKNELEKIGYTLLENEYKNNRTKMNMICSNNHHILMTFDSIRNGRRCRKCSGSQKHTYDEVKNDVEKQGYKLISTSYIDNKHKLDVQCPKGHVYKVKYNHWVTGSRCPKCRESKGENTINEVLKNFNINFIREYRFDDCRDIHTLPFDFYLPEYNTCIEFDGEQHFSSCDFYGGNQAYEIRKSHDNIKTQYCLDNKINLIRIPYWNIDYVYDIIVRELNLE